MTNKTKGCILSYMYIFLKGGDTPVNTYEIVQKRLDFLKQNFNGETSLWGDLKKETEILVKKLLEETVKIEFERYIGVPWYKRSKQRNGYRNGSYKRSLKTHLGEMKDINMPRCRKSGFRSQVIKRYKRRQIEVDKLVTDIFLHGVTTRNVEKVLKPLIGKISASTVSEITEPLQKEAEKFHRRALEDKYRYLIFDGIYCKVRTYRSERVVILVAYGITFDGKREVIDFMSAKNESEASWDIFLNSLYSRGLKGENTKLIVSDGGAGLIRALDFTYPMIPRQRCWVHKMRNVTNKLPKKVHKECLRSLREVYSTESRYQAYRKFRKWKEIWEEMYPKAVKCIEKDLEELLNFYGCPKEHWKKVRTTNVIERTFREVRKRIRIINMFVNVKSCDKIIYAVVISQNKKWEEHPLEGFKLEGVEKGVKIL